MRAAFNWPNSIIVNSSTTNNWLTTEVDTLPQAHFLHAPAACVHMLLSLHGEFGSTG